MRILDLAFTQMGHPLHRRRMASVESHKGAALDTGLTIGFLVVTEKRAKRIFQQPGLSQLLMSSLGPIPQRTVLPTFPSADYISRGNTGDCTHAPDDLHRISHPRAGPCGLAKTRRSAPFRHRQAVRTETKGQHRGDTGGQATTHGATHRRDRGAAS